MILKLCFRISSKMTRKKNKKIVPTEYEWLQMEALVRKDLFLSAKLVYCCLVLNCSLRNSTFCCQTIKNLAKATGLCRQTVITALSQLAQKDLIKVSRRYDPETKALLANKYELTMQSTKRK